MISAPGPKRNSPRASGFTLVELVLVLVVLSLLAGVTALSLGGFGRSQELDESARRLETALRLARAEAAGAGRRIRLRPDAETGTLDVVWEPEPLERPGEFESYPCNWRGYLPGGNVWVVGSELTGESRYRTLWSERASRDESDARFEPLTFYPDGTSDSGEIELESDAGTIVLRISGLTGVVTRVQPEHSEGIN
ncbi:MAG: GspH/FimT family pseudopilin [Phycisphaerae bacterium]